MVHGKLTTCAYWGIVVFYKHNKGWYSLGIYRVWKNFLFKYTPWINYCFICFHLTFICNINISFLTLCYDNKRDNLAIVWIGFIYIFFTKKTTHLKSRTVASFFFLNRPMFTCIFYLFYLFMFIFFVVKYVLTVLDRMKEAKGRPFWTKNC